MVQMNVTVPLSTERSSPVMNGLSTSSGVWITHIVTPGGSPHRSPPRSVFRPLVAAPRIDAWLRCAGPDQVTMWVIHSGSDGQHIVCQASGDVQRPFTTCLLYDVLALTH